MLELDTQFSRNLPLRIFLVKWLGAEESHEQMQENRSIMEIFMK